MSREERALGMRKSNLPSAAGMLNRKRQGSGQLGLVSGTFLTLARAISLEH